MVLAIGISPKLNTTGSSICRQLVFLQLTLGDCRVNRLSDRRGVRLSDWRGVRLGVCMEGGQAE